MVLSSSSSRTLRNSIEFHTRNISYLSSSSSSSSTKVFNSILETQAFGCTNNGARSSYLGLAFLKDTRRGFAKGKKSKDNDGGSTVEVVPDIGPTVKATAIAQMEAATVALSRELSKLRTGRASAGMLDHIIVETGGVKAPLSRLAVISVMDSKTLSVTPYDPNAIKELERAIVSSPLGLNPQVDGQRLIAAIPPLTKEHIQAICKVVSKSAEDVKQSIRRARQKAFDTIKKAASSIPKDDIKRMEKEVDELTKKFIKSAEDMCKSKEKEITSS
ncbi:Ribosome-recycling factor [Thalictrum thalictroides]|uniref:Ribosome-recycling factor, chloroplastic n=1 Tax=Thalictrum thalictroides TaxID=46969 RepID=A0A7J6XCJ8_THATH|nr:Ribosome-recycling factor [Thalictrum thalictroides]